MDGLTELLNKYKVSLGTVFGILSLVYAAWSYADGYFAHAADVKEVVKQISEMKKDDLDNKIFELQFKQESSPRTFSPLDKALLERYKRQLKDITKGN